MKSTSFLMLFPILIFGSACASPTESKSVEGGADAVDTTAVEVPRGSLFCQNVKEWAQLHADLDDFEADVDSGRKTPLSYQDALSRNVELFTEVPASAPESISDQMIVITEVSPESVEIDELQRREDAVEEVDEIVRRDCGVAFSFADTDFDGSGT